MEVFLWAMKEDVLSAASSSAEKNAAIMIRAIITSIATLAAATIIRETESGF